ncbi:MAG: hypothetical protein E6Z05_02460 [Enterococcus faecium]|nr:hypothetical protein [Enterococcus faecium]
MKIASEKIDQLTILVNQRIEDIIKEFEGEKIKNIKLTLTELGRSRPSSIGG